MAGRQRCVEEPSGFVGVRGDQPVHPVRGRNDGVERREPLGRGQIQEIFAIAVQHVEEEHRKLLCATGGRYVDRAAEPGRGDLEAMWSPVRAQRDGLAVRDQ